MKAFLFPGQGSQVVGMGRDLWEEFDSVREIFDMADETARAHISRLCFKGPMEDLTRTVNLQPAVTAVNLACLAVLQKEGFSPDAAAGHSLGEYSALAAAGALDRVQAMGLVHRRGVLMDREAQKHPGAMAAVVGLSIEQVREIVEKASEQGLVAVANHNTPVQVVITGDNEGVAAATALAKEAGARALPLKVSGAWHSPLMADAAKDFAEALKAAPFAEPKSPVALNVTGSLHRDPAEMAEIMAVQLTSPVRWVDAVNALFDAGMRVFVEVGPKNVLAGTVKKILAGPEHEEVRIHNVDSLKALEHVLKAEA